MSLISYIQSVSQNSQNNSGIGTIQYYSGANIYAVGYNGNTVFCRYAGTDRIPNLTSVMISRASSGGWFILSVIGKEDTKTRKEVIIDG